MGYAVSGAASQGLSVQIRHKYRLAGVNLRIELLHNHVCKFREPAVCGDACEPQVNQRPQASASLMLVRKWASSAQPRLPADVPLQAHNAFLYAFPAVLAREPESQSPSLMSSDTALREWIETLPAGPVKTQPQRKQ
jgi:hypothetical protein